MTKILTNDEINQFKKDGVIFLKGKFDTSWIKKLQAGIEKDIKNPSPRFKSHTLEKDAVVIDNSELSINDQLDIIIKLIDSKL